MDINTNDELPEKVITKKEYIEYLKKLKCEFGLSTKNLGEDAGLSQTKANDFLNAKRGLFFNDYESLCNQLFIDWKTVGKPYMKDEEKSVKSNKNSNPPPQIYKLPTKKKRFSFLGLGSVPPLPRYYVHRPEHIEPVKNILLGDTMPGTLVISAIAGMGGIGKSVLAAALVRDVDVSDRFEDGVLWATLGQNPNLLSTVSGWIQTLGDYDYKPTSLKEASMHLRIMLADKRFLLVVDDIWNPDHMEPFQIEGAGCRVLITTREAQIKGAIKYNIHEMNSEQSITLLENYLSETLNPTERQQAEVLTREVGYLPLAIELAAGRLEDGVHWDELLEDLQAEIARLETLDLDDKSFIGDLAISKQRSLVASFNLTLKRLSPDKLKHFAWLGVVQEDASITQEMAATLWDVSVRQAGAILRGFKQRSLLLSQAQRPGKMPTYRIHDLVHDLAQNLLTHKAYSGQLSGLELTLSEAHAKFLERYQKQTRGGQWHTVPWDGYIHNHFAWHCVQAQQPHLLHQLLKESTFEGRNGWYDVCDSQGRTASFVTDVARAWQLAEQGYSEDPSLSISLQVRYALIFSSLKSLSNNIPAELMAALVEHEVWMPAQGLAYVQQVQISSQRVDAFFKLSPHLPASLLPKALEVARNTQDEYHRACALMKLATHKPEIFNEALENIRNMQDEYRRASILIALVPLSITTNEALEAARNIQSEYYRADALTKLVPHMPEITSEALEAVSNIQSELSRASALRELAPHIPETSLPEALEVARNIQDESYRAYALTELVPHLPEITNEALEVVSNIQDESERAYALTELVPRMPETLLPKVLEVVRNMQDEDHRTNVLTELVPRMPETLLPKVLEVARNMQDEDHHAYALSELVPHLPEITNEALEATRNMQDESYRVGQTHLML